MTDVRLPKPGDAITEADVTEFRVEMPSSGAVAWKVDERSTDDIGTLIAVIS